MRGIAAAVAVLAFALGVAMLTSSPLAAQAEATEATLLDNSNPQDSGIGISSPTDWAFVQGFVTGDNPGGYVVNSIFMPRGGGVLQSEIWECQDGSSEELGSLVRTLGVEESSRPPLLTTDTTLAAVPGAVLEASTSYCLRFVFTRDQGLNVTFTRANGHCADVDGMPGWALFDYVSDYDISDDLAGFEFSQNWLDECIVLRFKGSALAETPGPPVDLTVERDRSVVTLSWREPALLGRRLVTKYQYRYRQSAEPDSAYSDWSDVPAGTRGADIVHSTVVNVPSADAQYIFQARAVNDEGAGFASETSTGATSPRFPEDADGGKTATRQIAENVTRRRVGAPITAFDPDGDTLSYSIAATEDSDGQAHLEAFDRDFELDPATGQVSAAPGASIDFEVRPSYKVRFQVSDGEDDDGDPESGTATIDDSLTLTIRVVDLGESGAGGIFGPGGIGVGDGGDGGASDGAGSDGAGGDDVEVGAATFVVANGWSAADVGVASLLAGHLPDAVVLYTAGDELSEVTERLLRDAVPAEVVIVGGTAAVSNEVRSRIETVSPGSVVSRVTGADRVATAAASARRALGTPDDDGDVVVVIANGWSPPDIGAASALAARTEGFAVAYTSAGHLPDATSALLRDYPVARVILVGGTAAISDDVRDAATAAAGGAPISRFTGADRVDTAAQSARRVFGNSATARHDVTLVMANGWSPPDVGVAAALAAVIDNAAVAYTTAQTLPSYTAALIRDYRIGRVIIVGGRAAVSDAVRQAVADAASNGAAIRRVSGSTRTHTAANAALDVLADL